jgi:hypothetical protein
MLIAHIQAELHVFEEVVDYAKPIRILITFDNGTFLRLRPGGDGEELVVDRLPLEDPVNMGKYGSTEIIDVTECSFKILKGASVGPPLAIRNLRGKLIGIALLRSGNDLFCVWINDDEFHWGDFDLLTEEMKSFSSVVKIEEGIYI